jgi:hypothetical protein
MGIVEAIPQILSELWAALKALGPEMVDALISLVPQLLQAGKDLIKGLVDGIIDAGQQVVDALMNIARNAVDKVKDFLKIGSPSKVFKEIGVDTVKGLVQGLDDSRDDAKASINGLLKEIQKGIGNPKEASLVKYVQGVGRELDAAWKAYDSTAAKLEKSNETLKKLQDDRSALSGNITSGVTGQFNLRDARGEDVKDEKGNVVSKGTFTMEGLQAHTSGMRRLAEQFNAHMAKLVKLGFPPQFVQMLAGYGMEEAIEIAKVLEQGTPDQRKAIIQDFAGFNTAAKKAGNTVAGQMFDVGIKAQEGLIKGLKSDKAKLEKAAKDMANTISRTVKKELGIKSPSTVFAGIGEDTGAGLVNGLRSTERNVAKAANDLVHVPSASSMSAPTGTTSASSPSGVAAGGLTVNITVPMDDLNQLRDFEHFMEMLRVRTRMGVGTR